MHIDRYERAWLTAVGIALGAFAAAMAAGFILFGIRLPSPVARINPNSFAGTPYANPGIKSLGGGRYEVDASQLYCESDAGQGGSGELRRGQLAFGEKRFRRTLQLDPARLRQPDR